MKYDKEISLRRTFAIISHPDAGKTTLTEKLLLFGGAIQVAGAVKSNKIKKHATSDFMEIERQRGISVATSVMSFEYNKTLINLLDTPGHKDFSEDTYRVLMAVDAVIMVIDAGLEQCAVITGSYNFSTAAQHRNAENALILRANPPLCTAYYDNWRRHYAHASIRR